MSPLIPIDQPVERPATRALSSRAAPQTPEGAGPERLPRKGMKFVGIEARTRLTTSFGDVPAHLLRVHDTLRTVDRKYVKIRKIDVLKLDRDFLSLHADAMPVRIPAGAIAAGIPQRDIFLAPDQAITVGSGSFDTRTIDSRTMLSRPKVVRELCEQVSYYRLILDTEATVYAEKALLHIELSAVAT